MSIDAPMPCFWIRVITEYPRSLSRSFLNIQRFLGFQVGTGIQAHCLSEDSPVSWLCASESLTDISVLSHVLPIDFSFNLGTELPQESLGF